MVPNSLSHSINTHISETLAIINSSLAHNFSTPAGKVEREKLREKVRGIDEEIQQINPQSIVNQPDRTDETLQAYRQLRANLTTLDWTISSFDKEITEKTIPSFFTRIVFFWKTFKPEEEVVPLVSFSNLSKSMLAARRKFLDSKIEAKGNVKKRVEASQTPGTWALGKTKKGQITLYVKDNEKAKATQFVIEVTPEGYKVNKKLFDTFTGLLQSFHAEIKLGGESEAEKVDGLIKGIKQITDTKLLEEIQRITEHSNKFRVLMKAAADNRKNFFPHIVTALGSLTDLTAQEMQEKDKMIRKLSRSLQLDEM